FFLSCGIQHIIATIERNDQKANDPLQPQPEMRDNGKLIPEAKAPKIFIKTAKRPVNKPIFNGNFILTKLGNKTLPNVIANPRMIVPANTDVTPSSERTIRPMVRTMKA